MKSRVTSHNKDAAQGFTLIELMLVIALMSTIGIFTSATGVSFYRSQILQETSNGLVSALRQAQSYAFTGKHDNAFGIKIQDDSYVLFEGDSYDTRVTSEDLVFHKAPAITVSGPQEITFSKILGTPSDTGILTLSLGSKETQFEILASGNIDR